MKRAQWISLAAIFALALLVTVLMLRNRQPPFLPADEDHVWHGTEACAECHGPNGIPQSPNHPVGRDCLRCHGSVR